MTLAHYELRYGKSARVPRHLRHALTDAVAKAIEASNAGHRHVPVNGSRFELYADLRQQEDGNALCIISAGEAFNGQKLKPGTTLYLGTTATRFATSVTAWRHVVRDYLAAVAACPHGVTYSAYGAMPRDLPWAVGFVTKEAAGLAPDDYNTVLTIARLAGLRFAEFCERATLAAERAGKDFTPDPETFPELA